MHANIFYCNTDVSYHNLTLESTRQNLPEFSMKIEDVKKVFCGEFRSVHDHDLL